MVDASTSEAPGGFAGRTVLVVGVRLAGASAARALLAAGADVVLTDRAETDEIAPLVAAGARFAGAVDTVPDGVDAVWVTPGVSPSHPIVLAAGARGLPVLGEAELAWRLRGPGAAPWLVVTGTNGKTTTTRMLESILHAAGRRTAAVGNVGVSLIDAVSAGDRYDVLAVELSSYQLHFSSSLRPAAGALLNLAPDHLDWHGSMQAYTDAKAKALRGHVAVAGVDDPVVRALLDAAPAATHVGVTTARAPGAGEFGLLDGRLVEMTPTGPLVLAAADTVRPAGTHNVANALVAAALARSAGVDPAAVADGLAAFAPDPHRHQSVAVVDGVEWIDDSKATNPHAAAAALGAHERIVWIAGGQLKGVEVDAFVADVAPRLVGAVLLGVDRAELAAALARHAPQIPVIDLDRADDGAMPDVVRAAAGLARPGDVVLLSPAAASYDMFAGFADRGRRFADAVRALSDNNRSDSDRSDSDRSDSDRSDSDRSGGRP